MLVECEIPPQVMLERLNQGREAEFHFPYSLCKGVVMYTRFSGQFLKPIRESDRMTIRRLALPARTEILLAAAHLPSKLFWSRESQNFECSELSRFIRECEETVGHARTMLVGDFNMNPFEEGVVASNGLHAVMTREIASRGVRTVQGRQYPFFYNPMWSCFGDATEGPPGTYYYERAEHVTYFWNVFDQVLVRPELLNRFRREDLMILDTDGDALFLSQRGLPNANEISDHLPVLFKLNL